MRSISSVGEQRIWNILCFRWLGDDVTIQAVALRDAITPNFYGYSVLGLDVLESAILNLSEYRLITEQWSRAFNAVLKKEPNGSFFVSRSLIRIIRKTEQISGWMSHIMSSKVVFIMAPKKSWT